MDSRSEDLDAVYDDAKGDEGLLRENLLPGAGVGIGAGVHSIESYPELIESSIPLIEDIPAQVFEKHVNNVQGDKLIHAAFSYGCAHYLIEGMNRAGLEDNYNTKAAVTYAATFAAGWYVKEKTMDNYADPGDMAANLVGASMAILEDRKDWELSEKSYNFIDDRVSRGLSWLESEPEEALEPGYLEDDD